MPRAKVEGIQPTPPSIRKESGIPMTQPVADRTPPETLSELAKRSGKK
jgi:hypothetical protein